MKIPADLSDFLILAGLILAGASLWQVSPWFTGAFLGSVILAAGYMRAP